MGVAERITESDPDGHHVAIRQPARAQQLGQSLAPDELRDQVGALVVGARLIQGHDPRVGEPCGRSGLALEAPADNAFAGDDLDRDLAVKPFVVREPHGAEPAGPEAPA